MTWFNEMFKAFWEECFATFGNECEHIVESLFLE